MLCVFQMLLGLTTGHVPITRRMLKIKVHLAHLITRRHSSTSPTLTSSHADTEPCWQRHRSACFTERAACFMEFAERGTKSENRSGRVDTHGTGPTQTTVTTAKLTCVLSCHEVRDLTVQSEGDGSWDSGFSLPSRCPCCPAHK